MLRKLIIFGIFASSSAALPSLLELDRFTARPTAAPAAVKAAAPAEPVALSGRKARLLADERGHFTGEFKLNGRRVMGMVDTGASAVAMNLSTARKLGLSVGAFSNSVQTANGTIKAARATVKTLSIGRVEAQDVDAMVLEDKALDGMLVGMSFLKRLRSFEVKDGGLLLVQ
ncbi:MAG: TIGR02281 family clan AA aspartic protease [Methylobacterium mesophilicum]|nr:TIGR02281 family clan AA aspartic protease [Methylobacterium mesophilicum]